MYKHIALLSLLLGLFLLIGCNASSIEPEDENVQPEYIRYQQDDQQNREPVPVQPGREQNMFDNQMLYPQGEHLPRQGTLSPKRAPSAETGDTADYRQKVIELTNEARSQNGESPVQLDNELAEAAQRKSEDMKENNYFSHTSPTYGSAADMLQEFDIEFTKASENIAAGQASPQEVVEGWLNSEGHRRNILDSEVTHIGVGYTPDGSYWTQLFIRK